MVSDQTLADRLARLTPQQRAALLRVAQSGKKDAPPAQATPIIRRRSLGQPIALTPAQLRMWFLEQLQPASGTYYAFDYLRVFGAIDEDALLRAYQELLRRHESLRTRFAAIDGVPHQIVEEEVHFDLVRFDLRQLPASEREGEGERIGNELLLYPFDLSKPPLMRVVLARLEDDVSLLLTNIHHIIGDAWSLEVIQREVGALYSAFRKQQPSPLPEPEVQFGDVVPWLALPETLARHDQQLEWWKKSLAGLPDVLDLPTDRPRPSVQSTRGARQDRFLPLPILDELQELARSERVTLFMLLLAAFQTLLARYANQTEFAIGTPVANRTSEATESLIGLFVNTITLRADLRGDPTVREMLRRVRDITLDAMAHQEVPFERVVDALGLERSAGRTPLFQTMLVLWNTGEESASRFEGLRMEGYSPTVAVARFDLTLVLSPMPHGLYYAFDYARDLFDPPAMAAFCGHFELLLRAMAANPDERISRLSFLDDGERGQLLRASRGAVVERPAGATLHGLVAAQAERTPDAEAIRAVGRSISYARLERWSDAIATQLRERGVEAGSRVALLADRSPEAIAALLGVLKAGAAYLPIDPGAPADRLAWLLADAGARLLLVPAALAQTATPPGVEMIVIADADAGTAMTPASGSDRDPAYVIYTSGSTGTPKGVVVEHRSAVNLALSFAESHGFAGHRVLMIPPLPFDASVGDVFPALATGAALVLHPAPSELNAVELARFCQEHGVTAIDAPAALWRRWTEEWVARGTDDPIPALRLMMVGGESVPMEQVRRFARLTKERVAFFNHYGPTEATVCATFYKTVDAAEVAFTELPIGTPVANTTAYVLDEQLQLVPQGVAGELYIGGAGVTRGYHGKPEQTAERFLTDPFSAEPGGRMYATGDLVRRLADGTLLFLGRRDRQIKLRGFRIEPGEIEAALLEHPLVRGTAVMLREDHPGERRLAAYLVSDAPIEPAALRGFLQERLPDYMIPAAFVRLDALPLTSNGKVDLRALPVPPKAAEEVRDIVLPRDETEAALVEIWRELLALDRVSIHDDFFAIGGDSLRTMPLIFRVQQQLGVELPLSSVFQAPSVAQFAKEVEKARGGQLPVGPDLEARIGPLPEIDPAAIAAGEMSGPPRTLLLTGATGFLGAFLLDELLRITGATVYCLVRAATEDDGRKRVRKNLAAYDLWRPEYEQRLAVLLGDLSEPRLGLAQPVWEELARSVDVIYHNGSTVNFAAPYERLEKSNVGGTREVLRLATRVRLKPVHFVSTLSSFLVEELSDAVVTEGTPLPPGSAVSGGYNQSKWVADRLVQAAREQGVPVSIYRPARITGSSRTGAWNTADFFPSFLKGCIQLGAVPATGEELNMSPVDFVGAGIARLSLHPPARNRTYHFFNNRTLALSRMAEVMNRCGFPVTTLPYADWLEALKGAVARGEENALGPFLTVFSPGSETKEPLFDTTRTDAALAALGLVCPPADEALAAMYLRGLALRGYLPLPVTAEGGV